jgi:inner membrane protein
MLYNSKVNLSGSFKDIDLQKLNILPEDVIWNESFVKFNVSDVKGLNDELILQWNNQPLQLITPVLRRQVRLKWLDGGAVA